MLKKILKRGVFGRRSLQRVFSTLHRVALRGMNIGGGSDAAESGERYVLHHLARSTPGNVVVFDVGANVGDYATMVREQLDRRVDLHCFEPSRSTFDNLSKRLGASARLNNFGLSDTAASVTLYANPERSGLSSVYDRKLDYIDVPMKPSETVSLRTADEYCREHGIERLHLLKLDVEGHEMAVLRGARELLNNDRIDLIQFEFGGCNIDSRTYFRDFYDLLVPRFRIYRILADGLWPIDRYEVLLESFDTTNYLAVRADSGVRF